MILFAFTHYSKTSLTQQSIAGGVQVQLALYYLSNKSKEHALFATTRIIYNGYFIPPATPWRSCQVPD